MFRRIAIGVIAYPGIKVSTVEARAILPGAIPSSGLYSATAATWLKRLTPATPGSRS